MDRDAVKPLSRWERRGIALFALVLAGFGGMVEYRSAFLSRRMGDLDVFLRAAWAVRNDGDLYRITSDNDWHYIYPPLYAIVMTPLADPPKGADPTRYVPYPISVAIVYIFNVVCFLFAAHVLASVLEALAGWQAQPAFCRRWWLLRVWPMVICFLPIGHTMMRGQVNVLVLAALCAALAGWLRGHNFRAGLWLSLAICIKIIPVYLLIYPLWRRDGRALLGAACGCLAGLVVIPGAVFGPTRAVEHHQTYATVFFAPFFRLNDDELVKREILGVNATKSVGVKNAIHHWMHPSPDGRPQEMPAAGKIAYLLLGVGMTLLTLWPRPTTGVGAAHQLGGLIVLMTIFSPVCHPDYLLFCLPVVMSLIAGAWQGHATLRVDWRVAAAFGVFFVACALAYLPGLEILIDKCAALFATLPLWIMPIVQMWRLRLDAMTEIAVTMEDRCVASFDR